MLFNFSEFNFLHNSYPEELLRFIYDLHIANSEQTNDSSDNNYSHDYYFYSCGRSRWCDQDFGHNCEYSRVSGSDNICFINNYLIHQHIQGHRPPQFASCPVAWPSPGSSPHVIWNATYSRLPCWSQDLQSLLWLKVLSSKNPSKNAYRHNHVSIHPHISTKELVWAEWASFYKKVEVGEEEGKTLGRCKWQGGRCGHRQGSFNQEGHEGKGTGTPSWGNSVFLCSESLVWGSPDFINTEWRLQALHRGGRVGMWTRGLDTWSSSCCCTCPPAVRSQTRGAPSWRPFPHWRGCVRGVGGVVWFTSTIMF